MDTTDIIVTSDHGFSTISKESQHQLDNQKQIRRHICLATCRYGFVALDLAHALNLPLIDPDDGYTVHRRKASTPKTAMD